MTWTVPNIFTAGTALPAAELNKVRDSLKAIGDPWTSYTPTWTAATTNPTLGNGTLSGAWMSAGQSVMFRVTLTFGSTTTVGSGAYSFTLPTAPKVYPMVFAGGAVLTSAATSFPIWGVCRSGVALELVADPTTAGSSWRNVTAAIPTGWVTGNSISIVGNYEAA